MLEVSTRRGAALVAPVLLALWLVVPVTGSGSPSGPAQVLPARQALPTSGLVARGPARPGEQVDAPGRRAAWFGTERGNLEAWVYPLKILRGLELSFTFRDRTIRASDIAREVEVRPEWTAITYGHEAFRVRQIIAAPLEQPAAMILLEVDTSFPITIHVAFHVDLHPMWPAGLGGQYSYWDADLPGFVLGEGSGSNVALIAAPGAVDPTIQPAHSLPDQPTGFALPIDPATASNHVYPIVVAGWTRGMQDPSSPDELRELALGLAADPVAALEPAAKHYRRLAADTAVISTPEPEIDAALRWAKVRLDQGLVCNPHLGCGLIAGYAASRAGYRPGFGWYFGGDAFYNSWALGAVGAHDTVRTALEFLAGNQRDDGKMMHELSQGAGSIDWFGDYPYGYYHGDTTPYFIDAAARHVRATGDLDWARSMLPHLQAAYDYCVSTDTDGDGLMENTSAGLAAVEMGALRSAPVHQDVYLAAVWTRALDGMADLATRLGLDSLAADANERHSRAGATLQRAYWLPGPGYFAFATLTDGTRLEELTAWSAVPAALGLVDPELSARGAAALASPALTTDWGIRMLASTSDLYDPLIYNQGTVWPFLTGFAALAAYDGYQARYGIDLLRTLARLSRDHSLGAVHEVLSGDRYLPMGSSVPHQLFSSSPLPTALLTGLFGVDIDLLARRIAIRPQLPVEWPDATLSQLPVGEGVLEVEIRQQAQEMTITTTLRGWQGQAPDLRLRPALPTGARQVRAGSTSLSSTTRGEATLVAWQPTWTRADDTLRSHTKLTWQDGARVTTASPHAGPAAPSAGLRVVRSYRASGALRLLIAGRSGVEYRLSVPSGSRTYWQHPAALPPGSTAPEQVDIVPVGEGEVSLVLRGAPGYLAAELTIESS